MEVIGYGILLAIGFYLAPIVVTFAIGVISAVGYIICRIFGGCK